MKPSNASTVAVRNVTLKTVDGNEHVCSFRQEGELVVVDFTEAMSGVYTLLLSTSDVTGKCMITISE
jgi:hypothetical protein